MANSVDPDQMPQNAASDLGFTLFAKAYLSLNLGLLQHLFFCLTIIGWIANSADPDHTRHSMECELDLHCLPTPVYPNT